MVATADILASELARALSRRRRRTPGVCALCGTPWRSGYPVKRYCSRACTMRAWRQKDKARRAALRAAQPKRRSRRRRKALDRSVMPAVV